MSSRKKPGVAFWATVVLIGLPLFYIGSFGPVVWLGNHDYLSDDVGEFMSTVYLPIIWLHVNGPVPIRDAIESYAEFWGWSH